MSYSIFAGLIVGLAGSLHCVGMCGPLLLALPFENHNKWIGAFFYHLGRIICYGLLGGFLAMLGVTLRYSGVHEFISIALGIFMIISLMFFYFNISIFKISFSNTWVIQKMKKYWSNFFQTKSLVTLTIIGFLNGLLPCGFVYVALGFSLLFNNPVDSFLYMFFFGIGTVPLLLGVNLFRNLLLNRWRQKIQILFPISIFLIGTLLIIRGLALNIPYLSPVLESLGCAACH